MRNPSRSVVLGDRVRVAGSPFARLRGLLGTTALPARHGLLLRPCRQVHSWFMRYALDLVFIDRDARVVRTVSDFGPSRISPRVREADAVIELPAGTLATSPAVAGDQLAIEPRPVVVDTPSVSEVNACL